ncbi:hypothetical protein DUNSADRAFT_11871 [Dunaliella salina]|uniref:N-acetyltransferase domain-containing protein n=1 Tax=Dunaliella salina TaxID=3046 RepID=A0ABQ7H483_DUNSA|nr:hypothetical protein DUNSADRAFT_11871 [Dunaliella salina]|eukprot:KAF5841664.1 hypothetical protein DUNSADRAFT_11871 [Dunaliella salina]
MSIGLRPGLHWCDHTWPLDAIHSKHSAARAEHKSLFSGVFAVLIMQRAFAGTPEAIGFNDATRYFDQVLQNLPRGVLFVARVFPDDQSLLPPNQDSRLIGVVALALQEDTRQPIPTLPPPAEDAYLSNMAVDAKFRRLGVGKLLLALCDEAAKVAGKDSISLHVRQGDNPANQLYLSYGYMEQARDNFIAAKLKQVRPRSLMRRTLKR